MITKEPKHVHVRRRKPRKVFQETVKARKKEKVKQRTRKKASEWTCSEVSGRASHLLTDERYQLLFWDVMCRSRFVLLGYFATA